MATATKSGAKKGSAKPRPIFAKTYFPVQVAVFEHSNDGRANYSVKLTRSFRRDEESEWETTEYLGVQDLLPAAISSESFSSSIHVPYCPWLSVAPLPGVFLFTPNQLPQD
jgi:hypothetical protein